MITILDQAKQETSYQKWHVYQVMASAFLINCEPKSAQVCLTESSKLWAEASKEMNATEKEECTQQLKLLETKVELER